MSQTALDHTLESIRINLEAVGTEVADILRQASEGKTLDGLGIVEATKHARQLQVDLDYLGLLMWKRRREQDPTAKHPSEIETR